MKTLFTSLALTVLLISGCKKDNSNNTNASKTYLISKITIATNQPGFTTTENYKYDSRNRVIGFGTEGATYRYTYDDNNNLLTAQTYNRSGTLTNTDNYTYSANVITAKTFYGDGSVNGSYIFTLNAQQQVVAFSADNQVYTYDSNGNVIFYSATGGLTQSGSYTYDNKKNPLSMVGAKNPHLMYLAHGSPVTTVNNVLVDQAYSNTYNYIYNGNGFPISANISTAHGTGFNVTYEYLIK